MLLEKRYREFLLGFSNEEDECRIEDEILSGDVDSSQLQLIEDELIDDYLFQRLSTQEERGFQLHFLLTEDRKRKLEFARAMIQFAAVRSVNLTDTPRESLLRNLSKVLLTWKAVGAFALAAAIILAVLLERRSVNLQKGIQEARNERSEIDRLQAAVAGHGSKTQEPAPSANKAPISSTQPATLPLKTESLPTLELRPLTRGLHPTAQLRIAEGTRHVRIVLDLPTSVSTKFRVELTRAAETPLWRRGSEASGATEPGKTMLILPVSLLPTGDYNIHVKNVESADDSPDLATYAFRVVGN